MLSAIGLVVALSSSSGTALPPQAEMEIAQKGLACFRRLGLVVPWDERSGEGAEDLFDRTCEDLAFRLVELQRIKKELRTAAYDRRSTGLAKPSPLELAASTYLVSEVERLNCSGKTSIEMPSPRAIAELPVIIKSLARTPVDIPQFHWIFEGIAKCRADGIPMGDLYEGRMNNAAVHRFRFDLARSTVLINRAAGRMVTQGLAGAYEPALLHSDSPYLRYATGDAEQFRQFFADKKYVDDFKFCDKLTDYFADDLRALGCSPQRLHQEMQIAKQEIASIRIAEAGSALKQFVDVPSKHWAAQATLELRKEGILIGDPDYRFHG